MFFFRIESKVPMPVWIKLLYTISFFMVFPMNFGGFFEDQSLGILKGSCGMPLTTFLFNTYSTKNLPWRCTQT